MHRFIERHSLGDYATLYRRSIEDPAWFWGAVAADPGLEWMRPYRQVLDTSRGIPWARWFTGGQTNLVLNCLDRHIRAGRADYPAIVWEGEDGAVRILTYEELSEEVCRLAGARA